MSALTGQLRWPRWLSTKDLVADECGGCGQVRRCVPHHAQLHECKLSSVLGDLPVHLIATVGTMKQIQEVRCCWAGNLETKSCKQRALHHEDVLLVVSVVCDVDKVGHIWRAHLLVLGGHKHSNHPNQLQTATNDRHPCQVPVNKAHCEEESLDPQLVFQVHLHKPVHKDCTHPPIDVPLRLHVIGSGHVQHLVMKQLAVDFTGVFLHLLRIRQLLFCIGSWGRSCGSSRASGRQARTFCFQVPFTPWSAFCRQCSWHRRGRAQLRRWCQCGCRCSH
mmetsp:Transcript_47578/g.110185  ORF Transcript_47578/g.110185 Transcript_47578/m.110185 type:complete len:277 (-) Transcript_47578:296-1126(-)